MGIIFDARKYDTGESYDGQLDNGGEVVHIRKIVIDALNEYIPGYRCRIKKNTILIKGSQDPSRYPDADRRVEFVKLKGSFQGFDISKKKTWATAKIDSILYGGLDGKIKIKNAIKVDSLGALSSWNKLSDRKLVSSVFEGDDIIHSAQRPGGGRGLRGYAGNDTIYVHDGATIVDCDEGADRIVVTKKASKFYPHFYPPY